ncbi:signal peptidase I [Sanguibacter suaedae]|uniref:Signal peptidase I n=1 Tax=Sanguibacter suaedae TaxID=2795737 RepID=A0A934MAI6_9MICO|nr:signal peptidase I [Sanguibacter suaedae]MBI9115645.1 signal peptidase I [Sanguibacter suaedae]
MTRASRRGDRAGRAARARQRCLTVASVVGALSIVWFACSLAFGWSLVLFKTGSMAPTYPTGAAAVSVPVSAEDIEVGDVVTVPRAQGGLPVTHRVVDVAPVASDPAARQLVLRGDANAIDDRDPYVVRDAEKIVGGVPYVGYAVTVLAQPTTLLVVTVLVALLTVWMLWPAREEPDAPDEGRAAPETPTTTDDAQTARSAVAHR